MPKFHDLLICGISTNIQNYVKDFDEIVKSTDYDYKESGLVQESLIRLGFLTVLPVKDIHGSIGKISDKRYSILMTNLVNYLKE